jgi:Flp pilus assembly pilin Flp
MFRKLYSKVYLFINEDKGVTGIEYSFIAAIVGGGIMAASFFMGDSLNEMFNGDGGMNTLLDGVTDRYSDGGGDVGN